MPDEIFLIVSSRTVSSELIDVIVTSSVRTYGFESRHHRREQSHKVSNLPVNVRHYYIKNIDEELFVQYIGSELRT